jgi:spore coat protein U-like protein
MSRLSSRSLLLTAAISSLALGGTLWVKPALAGSATSNISLSASVPANCTINTSPIAFGAYYTDSGTTASPGILLNCTNGATATITLGQGANADSGSSDAAPLRRLSNGSGSYLAYQIYSDPSYTTVWGNTAGTGVSYTGTGYSDTDTTIYVKIESGQNATVGNYTDTVVATVTY